MNPMHIISIILKKLLLISILLAINTNVPKICGSENLQTTSTIDSICAPTNYKQACISTVSSLAQNNTTSPMDVLNASISAVIQELTTAGSSLISNTSANEQALHDCNELLNYALDDLHLSLTLVEESDLQTISVKELDLMNLLSAVISFQETCLDGFNDEPDLRAMVSNTLLNAIQLTSNALAFVDEMPNIYNALNIPMTKSGGPRPMGVEKSGYPWWMSVDDQGLLAGGNNGLIPHAVVAKDGSGRFRTITDALLAYPRGHLGRYVVYVKQGIYDEYVTVTQEQVFMYGDGPTKTIVTGNKSHKSGSATVQSTSFSAIGNGFIAKSMGFQNTAGPAADQAVALRSQSDRSAFFDVHINGYQDTLYTQAHLQFYTNCIISGTIDFIFGDATVLIQNCLIISKLPVSGQQTTITAQGRSQPRETTGIVIQNCHIIADAKLFPVRFQVKSYLGRPWKVYSRTIVMESTVDDFIQPDGWMPWQGSTFALDTCFFGEYANVGLGAVTNRRVKWNGFKVITDRNEAMRYTAGSFIQGNTWLRGTGAPFYLGLKG